MALLKRNLILTNKNKNSNEMALLTIEKSANGFTGNLKMFNVKADNLMLGIACNDQPALKQSMQLVNNTYNFNLNSNFNLSHKLSAVVVTQNNNQTVPLLWASEQHDNAYKTKILQELFKNDTQSTVTKKQMVQEKVVQSNSHEPDNSSKKLNLDELFDIQDENEINNIIDNNLKTEKVESPVSEKPKNAVFHEDTFKMKNNLKDGDIFFDLISDQLEDLFSKYPSEAKLEQLIPNSKWVKVDYENNGSIYVLGLIYDDINLKYICYGIPGEFSSNPPKELESYSQWLPLDANDVSAGGYWVMYQDALTGENIKIEAI